MTKFILGVVLAILVASPVAAAHKPFIRVNEGDQIIWGDSFTVTYRGSDWARAYCEQNNQVVWAELVYLPGEGGPRQITPIVPYHPGSYTQCTVTLVKIAVSRRERELARDTFVIYSPV